MAVRLTDLKLEAPPLAGTPRQHRDAVEVNFTAPLDNIMGHSGGWGRGLGSGVMTLALNRITNRWVGRSEHGLRGHAVQPESLDKLTAAAHTRRKCISVRASGSGGSGGSGVLSVNGRRRNQGGSCRVLKLKQGGTERLRLQQSGSE